MSGPSRAAVVLFLTTFATAAATADGPTLTGLFPAGGQRGQSVSVTAAGTFPHWPLRAWVDAPGLAVEAGTEKGTLTFRIDAEAAPGVRWVRLHDDEGAAALRSFVIGTLPEIAEVEPNDAPSKPQAITPPSATINGRLAKGGDVDGYAIPLKRGETLVADLEANRHLGSPMDAVMQVATPAGFVLAQNDDDIGRDPRIVFEAPADGTYIVRLFAFPATPDSSIRFAGGDAYIYRLTLTTGGFLAQPFPPAVTRDGPATVAAIGWNLPDAARLLSIPDAGGDVRTLGHPQLAGTAEVRIVAGPVVVEDESAAADAAQELADPVRLAGRIDPPGDRDTYRLTLKKGDKRVVRVEADGLGTPLDPVLRITDAAGKVIAEEDDHRKDHDPELTITAPADGEYRIQVRDLNGRGGPRFAYLLSIQPPTPDVVLTLAADRFETTADKPATVAVTIDRRDGFDAPIEVVAEGLPEGITATSATSKPGDATAKAVTLTLTATPGAVAGPFRIVGKPATGEPRVALAPIAGYDAKIDRPWLTGRPATKP